MIIVAPMGLSPQCQQVLVDGTGTVLAVGGSNFVKTGNIAAGDIDRLYDVWLAEQKGNRFNLIKRLGNERTSAICRGYDQKLRVVEKWF